MNNFFIAFAFVLLYGSGFVAAKIGLNYADPIFFLASRFLLAGSVLAIFCYLLKAKKKFSLIVYLHCAIAGFFLIGIFSVSVFISLKLGTSPAISSLVISFQPILVGIASRFIWKKSINLPQWLGFILGLLGVTFILINELGRTQWLGFFMSVIGLLGLTIGSLYQKYFCAQVDIFTSGAIHSFSAALFCFLLLLIFPMSSVEWHPQFIGALLWMSLAVSVCALSLFYLLIQRMPVSQVSSLFYLMPISTLVLSLIFFQARIDLLSILGIFITALAMFLVNGLAPMKTYIRNIKIRDMKRLS